ncbi:MAG: pseudouridine synthase, partial [bacterium]
MQLNKYIALSGLTSRRKANIPIKQGKITVNGKTVNELGVTINPQKDIIKLNNKVLKIPTQYRYILLNKPINTITSFQDKRNRKLVIDYVDIKERVFPVGRLDYDTTGVLLLTNDGDLAYRLSHPKYEIDKMYTVWVQGFITHEEVKKLTSGVNIGIRENVKAQVKIRERKSEESLLEIIIHEGKKRQIKRMMKKINHPVINLNRTVFAGLTTQGLKQGEWRNLQSH